MNQVEFKKFPILATVLAIIGVVLAVAAITSSLGVSNYTGGSVFLGMCLLVASVLFVAGLTTGKIMLLKIISIITLCCVIFANFVITITKFGMRELVLFAVVLLMLIASVLCFIYFLTMRSERIKKMYFISNLVVVGLIAIYFILYVIKDIGYFVTGEQDSLMYPYYFILLAYAVVAAIPLVIQYSLAKKENDVEEPKQE